MRKRKETQSTVKITKSLSGQIRPRGIAAVVDVNREHFPNPNAA